MSASTVELETKIREDFKITELQGVPQLSSHFDLLVFSASRAQTEVHFTIF